MFTGIIQSLGKIVDSSVNDEGLCLGVQLGELDCVAVNIGDSIAVNGACLTVTDLEDSTARFDISEETLDKCLIGTWKEGDTVNLELALTLNTPLGGHLVSGHVDTTAILIDRERFDQYTKMRFQIDKTFGRFVAAKGSVAIDGISLTTNRVFDRENKTEFDVMLVPHTLSNTTLGTLLPEHKVHMEIDIIARYLSRLLDTGVRREG